jgi:hypothetical protein
LIFIAWFEFCHSSTSIKDDVVSRECVPSFSTVSTAGVSGGLPREPATETGKYFRAKKGH